MSPVNRSPDGTQPDNAHLQPEAGQQSFVYGHMVLRCKATLDPRHLTIKQGVRTFQVAIPKLKYLFVQSSRTTPQQTLVLAEERAPGRNKIHRFYANPDDPQFLALVKAILTLRPDVDLQGLEEKLALKKMGVPNTGLVGLALMVLLVPAIVGIALLPQAIHGLDFAKDNISLASLANGQRLKSRNVVITDARAQMSESIEVTTNRKGGVQSESSTKYFVPVVPSTWDKSQAVHVILETDELNSAEEARLERATKFSGIARNVLWEGLSSGDREYFANNVELTLSDDLLLVEYRANPRFDLLVFVGATGLTFTIMAVIALGVWLKKRLDSSPRHG